MGWLVHTPTPISDISDFKLALEALAQAQDSRGRIKKVLPRRQLSQTELDVLREKCDKYVKQNGYFQVHKTLDEASHGQWMNLIWDSQFLGDGSQVGPPTALAQDVSDRSEPRESINPLQSSNEGNRELQDQRQLKSHEHQGVWTRRSNLRLDRASSEVPVTDSELHPRATSDCRSSAEVSENTYHSALSQPGVRRKRFLFGELREEDEYAQLLQTQKLWPVDVIAEQNWSGRGQHSQFQKDEQKVIDEILEVKENLGSTRTAIVQSVRCRRILLARKTITCGKHTMTKKEAIDEVSHLTRLNHAHILRIVGTYVQGRELSILLYPVADYNLETFLEALRAYNIDPLSRIEMSFSCSKFYSCLSSAVRYIHRNLTKHMDIKPQNILVRKLSKSHDGLQTRQVLYRAYIADFGIARSYETLEAIETDGRMSFTRHYAAPEVVKQDLRGLPADIFSLGCVFLEIFAAQFPFGTEQARALLNCNPSRDSSYQANIEELQRLLQSTMIELPESTPTTTLHIFVRMLNEIPQERPTAEQLCVHFGELSCYTFGQESFEAMR